ncbi:MAG: DUF58 domain-containing protein [Lachnospiraceae bacterium]|nr:DUF58 domain-containing protein [Lachnospiraceae bacterium]
MLFFMMVVNTILSIAYIFYVFFTIKIYQTIPERTITKKERVSYQVKLSNEGVATYGAVSLHFLDKLSVISRTEELGNMSMEPGQEMAFQTEVLCMYSGIYEIGVDMIEIMDYFRIFRIRFPMPEKLKVTVKPRIRELDSIAAVIEEEECRNSGQRGERTDLVDSEVRKFVPGDNRRWIHWKNSAKRLEWMVRNPTAEEVSSYVIFVDPWVAAADTVERIAICDRIREMAAALAQYIYSSGYQLLVVMEDVDGQEICSRRAFEDFIKRLTECNFSDKATDLNAALEEQNIRTQADIPFLVVTQHPEKIADNVREVVRGFRNLHFFDLQNRVLWEK